MSSAPDNDLQAFVTDFGLVRDGETAIWSVLGGGVSCDVWRVDVDGRSFCIKRALAQLRVEAEWRAPVERNATEWAWFETVHDICADAAPALIAHDPARGLFAMEFLAPERYQLWKARLLAGEVDAGFADRVGDTPGRIHAATAGDARIAGRFATDDAFYALRIEPYLLATGARHRDLQTVFEALAARTAETHLALVHGDVRPKNILIGPRRPVFLDAETAWYGDPAFDRAFCLNHLLLKCLWNRRAVTRFLACFDRLAQTYLGAVTWEPREEIEARNQLDELGEEVGCRDEPSAVRGHQLRPCPEAKRGEAGLDVCRQPGGEQTVAGREGGNHGCL